MMADWGTYSLQDFLLFSPRTYFRMLEQHNAALWPAHLLAILLGAAAMAAVSANRFTRIAIGLLALGMLSVAWSFLFKRYASINWAAPWFAGLFALEAVMLIAACRTAWRKCRPCGLTLFAFAVLAMPFIGILSRGSWRQGEVFAILPDPTALAILAALTCAPRLAQVVLAPIPILWCAFSGATLWAMAAPDAWVVPTAALLAVICMLRSAHAAR